MPKLCPNLFLHRRDYSFPSFANMSKPIALNSMGTKEIALAIKDIKAGKNLSPRFHTAAAAMEYLKRR